MILDYDDYGPYEPAFTSHWTLVTRPQRGVPMSPSSTRTTCPGRVAAGSGGVGRAKPQQQWISFFHFAKSIIIYMDLYGLFTCMCMYIYIELYWDFDVFWYFIQSFHTWTEKSPVKRLALPPRALRTAALWSKSCGFGWGYMV